MDGENNGKPNKKMGDLGGKPPIFGNILYIYIYTWNPNDPCFDWKRPCFRGLTFKNRRHLGSNIHLAPEKMVLGR